MIYIQDRANNTLGVIEKYYNDTHQMILESGVSSYSFTVPKNISDAQHIIEGNYIIIVDDNGLGWKFTIMSVTQTHTELTVYCEDVGLELINMVKDSWNAPDEKQSSTYYIEKAIAGSKWKIGLNEISDLSRTLKWEGRDTSLNRLLSVCTQFDHAEVEFRVKFRNLKVTDYIINIYKKRGTDRSDIQLVYGENIDDITKTSSIEELSTALMGVGSEKELPENSPEGTIPEHVTFKDLSYDDGEYYTTVGNPFLRARLANQQFNLSDNYIEDFYEYDTSDPQELLNRTTTQLKERSQVKVNYEISVVKFNHSLQLGDTITIIDHDYKPELFLSGRVLEIDKSYTDPSQDKLVLGNFLILHSDIRDDLRNLQNDIKNMKPMKNYSWLRYADDDKGTNISPVPTPTTKYFALLVNKTTGIPSDNPSDYIGHWQLIQGADGKDGVAGEKGADGRTAYTHFAYANDVSGTTDFSVDDPTGRAYMGVLSDFIKEDSTNPDDYVWSLVKGERGEQGIQGLQGEDGKNGIAGEKGADGKTSYTHIAYANDANGGGFSQTPDNHAYVGMYVDFVEQDSTDPKKYAWSLIKGEDGLNGKDGIAGAKGEDGRTPYFHSAWADSKDGKINFSLTDATNRGYLGTYTDFTQADSTDPTKYAWVELVGAIEIGGRNLVSGTNQEYAMGYGIPTTSWKDGYAYLKLPTNVINNEILPQGSHTFGYTMTQGATYTQAIWFETDATVKDLSMVQITWYTGAGHDYQPARVQKLGQNSYKIVSTYTWPGKSDNNVRLFDIEALNSSFDLSTGTYLKFGKLKLEIGNKATDWSPAPEDTQGQIDTINKGLADANSKISSVTKVDVQATAPTNPKKGDQWWVKEANGEINAFKIWDGAKWAPSTITQSLLVIKELDAVNINGSVINGSKFTNGFDFKGIDGIHFQGVTTIADGAVDSTWKMPANNQTGHSRMSASGFESVVNNPTGTIIKQARLGMGELFLFGDNVSGWINEQDSYRNSGVPSYLNNWGVWNQATQVRITRNGRQVTISGYIKHYGGTVSPIIQVPAWAYPANPTEIINGVSFDDGVGNSKACNLSMSAYGTLSNNAGVQVNGYLSFSANYTGVDIK